MSKNEKTTEIEIITLTFDEDVTVECEVVAYFEAAGKGYAALAPLSKPEGAEYEEGDVLLYRYTELEGDEFILDAIEDDEEFDAAADAFDEILDTMAFNDME